MRKLLPLFCVALFVGGCAVRESAPRTRLGALPFPGPFTLYCTADPEQLGFHQYGRLPRFFQADEKERGIVYTAKAGFLDVAHMRESIDWTRYQTVQLRQALRDGDRKLALHAKDRSRLYVTIAYPSDWKQIPADERGALIDEIAVRAGQQLTLVRMTWHETATWFGYKRVPLLDESWSSFSYDDTMSHVIGTRVAARAMRAGERGLDADADAFDKSATEALKAELSELGAVGPRETDAAARAVEGKWWKDGRPLKRHLDTADLNAPHPVVHPWLIGASSEPEPFELPSLHDVRGRDLSGMLSVEIEPRFAEAGNALRRLPGGKRKRLSAHQDLPALMRVVRDDFRERFGPTVIDPPWATGPAEAPTAQAPPKAEHVTTQVASDGEPRPADTTR